MALGFFLEKRKIVRVLIFHLMSLLLVSNRSHGNRNDNYNFKDFSIILLQIVKFSCIMSLLQWCMFIYIFGKLSVFMFLN